MGGELMGLMAPAPRRRKDDRRVTRNDLRMVQARARLNP